MSFASRFTLILAALLALATPTHAAGPVQKCSGRAVDSTVSTVTIWLGVDNTGTRDGSVHHGTGWLRIVNAGSGTPSIQVDGIGPLITTTARRPTASCGVLNATSTAVECPINVEGLLLTVSSCTGACDLELAGCGSED
jgi:hypothetical protein